MITEDWPHHYCSCNGPLVLSKELAVVHTGPRQRDGVIQVAQTSKDQ